MGSLTSETLLAIAAVALSWSLVGIFTLVMLSSIGLPGLNGFVGEFMIMVGSFLTRRWWTVVAARPT